MSTVTVRKKILEHAHKTGKITTAEANKIGCPYYYCNHQKYVSEILSRLVKSGMLKRESRGLYVPGIKKQSKTPQDHGPTLFE